MSEFRLVISIPMKLEGFKEELEEKATELGLSKSAFCIMAIKKALKEA